MVPTHVIVSSSHEFLANHVEHQYLNEWWTGIIPTHLTSCLSEGVRGITDQGIAEDLTERFANTVKFIVDSGMTQQKAPAIACRPPYGTIPCTFVKVPYDAVCYDNFNYIECPTSSPYATDSDGGWGEFGSATHEFYNEDGTMRIDDRGNKKDK